MPETPHGVSLKLSEAKTGSQNASSQLKALIPVLSGSLAGASGILLGHPFDSLKVRMQLNQNLDTNKLTKRKIMQQLYRGVFPPLLTAGVLQAFLFTVYERIRSILFSHPTFSRRSISKTNSSQGSQGNHFSKEAINHLNVCILAGTGGGVLLSFISTPIGFVKLQQQVSSESSILSVIKDCYRRASFRCFYRAYTCMLILEAPGRGIYFGSYEYLKMYINNYKYKVRDNNEDGMFPLQVRKDSLL